MVTKQYNMENETFTKQMRKATKAHHNLSDAMVNAKLAFALSNNAVWAEGLLIFYEIFRYLEEAMDSLDNENLKLLHIEGMNRTKAFEEDLRHYLGSDWKKCYKIRESVAKYLLHLKTLEKTDSDLLMAYIYHLYMGLFSGGQILRKKRLLFKKLFNSNNIQGECITDFGDFKISQLKHDLAESMNKIADRLDDKKKSKLIEESKKVFELNNMIIQTVKGTNKIIIQKLLIIFFIFFILLIYMFILK